MSIITEKIKYTCINTQELFKFLKNYNSIYGITYNYMFENPKISTKIITKHQNSMNNLILDSHFKNSCIFDCKSEISKNKNKKIIFGGKKLFFDRMTGKVSREEFQVKKLRPLCSVGEASQKGNRKFQILDTNTILFKPSKKEHFILNLVSVGKNYQKKLKLLKILQDNCSCPITYHLDSEYIYITFNDSLIQHEHNNKKENRIFSVDLNPNYIGWSVIDWIDTENYNIIESGLISLKDLNDLENSLNLSSNHKFRKYLTNKKQYECIDIAHYLVKIANHFRCKIFSIEDLRIKSKDKKLGKRYNRICNNQWCRNTLVNCIVKLNDNYGIRTLKINCAYSSFIGNLVYRKENLPDPILASIEISRRGYEFYHQYILKDKIKTKNIIVFDTPKSHIKIKQSLEELGYFDDFKSVKELYDSLKKIEMRYRLSLNTVLDSGRSFLRKKHIKSFKTFYIF